MPITWLVFENKLFYFKYFYLKKILKRLNVYTLTFYIKNLFSANCSFHCRYTTKYVYVCATLYVNFSYCWINLNIFNRVVECWSFYVRAWTRLIKRLMVASAYQRSSCLRMIVGEALQICFFFFSCFQKKV